MSLFSLLGYLLFYVGIFAGFVGFLWLLKSLFDKRKKSKKETTSDTEKVE